METTTTLFLALVIAVLSAIDIYGAAPSAIFVDGHIEGIGIGLIILALVTLWNGAFVRKLALYVALIGALYLLGSHLEAIQNVL